MALQLVQALWPGLCFASSPAPHVPLAAPASYPAIHSSSRGNRCQLLSMSTSASRRGARDRLAPGTSVQIRGDMERCEAGERTPPPPPPPVNLSFSYFGDSQATRRAIVRCRERVVGWRVGPSRKCAGRGVLRDCCAHASDSSKVSAGAAAGKSKCATCKCAKSSASGRASSEL